MTQFWAGFGWGFLTVAVPMIFVLIMVERHLASVMELLKLTWKADKGEEGEKK